MRNLIVSVKPGRRSLQLDLLRIIFATFVVLSHAAELTDGNRVREPLARFTHTAVTFGAVGVDGFFLLSGFLIVRSWQLDPTILDFLRKRILRIVPGYLVAVLITVLAVGLFAPAIPNFFHQFHRDFVISILLLGVPHTPPVFPGMSNPDANGSLWTIFFEFRCYLLVVLIGVAGLLRKPFFWSLATVLLSLGSYSRRMQDILGHYGPINIFGESFQFFHLSAIFFIGGCYFLYRDRIPFRPLLAAIAVGVLIVAPVIFPRFFEAAIVLFGGYLLFYLGSLSLPSLNWMRRVPDISYGMYLYGWTVESLWIYFHHGSPWITFVVSTLICIPLGWLSWHLVERPMLKLKRHPSVPLPAP